MDSLGLEILRIAIPAALALAADPVASLIDTVFIGHIGLFVNHFISLYKIYDQLPLSSFDALVCILVFLIMYRGSRTCGSWSFHSNLQPSIKDYYIPSC